jgi:hypothetical protein
MWKGALLFSEPSSLVLHDLRQSNGTPLTQTYPSAFSCLTRPK